MSCRKKPCHKPSMPADGFFHSAYQNGDDWGCVYGSVLPTFMSYTWTKWLSFKRTRKSWHQYLDELQWLHCDPPVFYCLLATLFGFVNRVPLIFPNRSNHHFAQQFMAIQCGKRHSKTMPIFPENGCFKKHRKNFFHVDLYSDFDGISHISHILSNLGGPNPIKIPISIHPSMTRSQAAGGRTCEIIALNLPGESLPHHFQYTSEPRDRRDPRITGFWWFHGDFMVISWWFVLYYI